MKPVTRLGLVVVLSAMAAAPSYAESHDDELRIYAVNVVKTTPLKAPTTGYGIYLGNGGVITAAHVIGRWGFLKNPRVLIAGLDLPARIVKEGALEEVDLTVLAIDDEKLPLRVRLRRNPLCKHAPIPGESVIAVVPEAATRSRILSPLAVAPGARQRFGTLTSEVAEASGSGVFDAEKRCLKGIMSRRIPKFGYRRVDGKVVAEPAGFAGYFVPASEIAKFVPAEFRF
jgi:hypothetical protein